MINDEILNLIKKHALLFNSEIHGITHWKSVERNGLYLTKFTGADPKVVSLFAYFHDCMREHDGHDVKHGLWAAKFAKYSRKMLDVTDVQIDQLYKACAGHTGGRNAPDVTIATCWDADRLDLGRVGVVPNSKYLFSDEAKRIAQDGDFVVLIK
ncbi:MAG: hypothetical protein HOM78_10465 [Candidatus Marinimicrobia bacterium]|nr:hypothetical protein [Candidatus Neomarinimicrobiota bacterium]